MNEIPPEQLDTISERELKVRTRRSFIAAGAAAAFGLLGFRWLLSGNEGGAPKILRKAFQFNEKIGRGVFDPSRESSRTPAPINGTEFRLNGDIGLDYEVDLASWSLVYGSEQGGTQKTLTMADLEKLPQSATHAEFRCIEGWSEPVAYAGVKFSDFLAAVDPAGKSMPYVGLETPDGEYFIGVDMESMLHPQTLLATSMNGVPLTDDHGAPVRLIIPIKYGIKSLKRVGRIFLAENRPRDYWAQEGYDWYSGL